jgi:hypothetical protein
MGTTSELPDAGGKQGGRARLRTSLIPLIIRRWSLFLFIMDCFTLFLYVLGIRQGFMNATQAALLRLASVFGLALFMAAAFGTAAAFRFLFRPGRYRFFLGAGGYLLAGCFGAGSAAFALFILIAGGGNGG